MIGLLSIIVFLLPFSGTINLAFAEIMFDVKTPILEKANLKTIKQGVTSSINSTSWGKTTEFGEDYALWLDNLSRIKNENKITVKLTVELRKPAMFGRGNLLSKKEVMIAYSEDIIKGAASKDLNELYRLIHEELNFTGTTQQILNSARESTVVVASNQLPGSEIFFGKLVGSLNNELNRKPTPSETWEATILGAKILLLLDNMLKVP